MEWNPINGKFDQFLHELVKKYNNNKTLLPPKFYVVSLIAYSSAALKQC